MIRSPEAVEVRAKCRVRAVARWAECPEVLTVFRLKMNKAPVVNEVEVA